MGNNLEEDVNELLDAGKISPETAIKMLKTNSGQKTFIRKTISNPKNPKQYHPQNYSQPIIQTQEKPIKSPNSNSTKRILLTAAILLAVIAGPIEYTKYRERKQQENASREQSQQTRTQNPVQDYSNSQPVQQVEQEPIQEEITQEEIIQETIVGLNRWVSSPKLNYEFAVKGVGEKRINNYEYAQYCGTAKNIPSDQVAGWKSYFWDLIIIDVVAKGKTDSDLSINPQSFYLGGCSPTLIKDKTLVEMVSGTTEQIRVTRLTPAEMRLVYCEGSNMTGNGIPEILPRSGIMRLSTDEDEFKSLVEIGRMENQELQY